jgi:hypothetical protein
MGSRCGSAVTWWKWENKLNWEDPGSLPTPGNLFKNYLFNYGQGRFKKVYYYNRIKNYSVLRQFVAAISVAATSVATTSVAFMNLTICRRRICRPPLICRRRIRRRMIRRHPQSVALPNPSPLGAYLNQKSGPELLEFRLLADKNFFCQIRKLIRPNLT